MLKIKVELWPYGHSDMTKQIGEITIGNTGKQNNNGEHVYTYTGWYQDEPNGDGLITAHKFTGKVEHWRPHPVLFLLYKVLYKEMIQWISEQKWDY
jgi:hypothetical protein